MKKKNKKIIGIIGLIILAGLVLRFGFNPFVTVGSDCNLGSWSAPSYDSLTQKMIISVPSGVIKTTGGCFGTGAVSGWDTGGMGITNEQICNQIQQRWDADAQVCVYGDDTWFKDKNITYSGTCMVTNARGTFPNELGAIISFDGARINVANNEQSNGLGSYYSCSGQITIKPIIANTPLIEPTPPTPPTSKGFLSFSFLKEINDWISNLFSKLLGLNIAGLTQIEPNTQQTYQISMSVLIPDSDYTDGTISYQYGYWGIVDVNNNTLQSGTIDGVNGNFMKNITITTPSNPGNYMLVGIVSQNDGIFNTTKKSLGLCTGSDCWSYTGERIINKEAISLSNKYIIAPPTKPASNGFSQFIQSIINFIKSLFGI